jgi:DNA repair photolyase
MTIIEIQAKTILATVGRHDESFGLHYNMNLYRGCQHQCIYCDSRSECYGIENFHDILVKVNALEILDRELARKRRKGVVGTGSMHDPYMPVEKKYNLTGRALALLAKHHFGVHVITKSTLVLRDIPLLQQVGQVHAAVSFSISTTDDDLSRKIEPAAPPVSERFEAIRALAGQGIAAGVCMMPVLPFLEDTPENITAVVDRAADCGARYIIPWFGMSLRDRQREYFYRQLDRLFPGLREKYERAYGARYGAPARFADRLAEQFYTQCERLGLDTRAPRFEVRPPPEQLSLFP